MFARVMQQLNKLEKVCTMSRNTQSKLLTHPTVIWHQFQKSHAMLVARAEQWNDAIEFGK